MWLVRWRSQGPVRGQPLDSAGENSFITLSADVNSNKKVLEDLGSSMMGHGAYAVSLRSLCSSAHKGRHYPVTISCSLSQGHFQPEKEEEDAGGGRKEALHVSSPSS